MAGNVKLNHRTIQEYLDGEHGVGEDLDARIAKVLAAAQATGPVRSGDYRNSLRIETVHTDRVVKRVIADVGYAWAVEARHGTLARALDAAGGS